MRNNQNDQFMNQVKLLDSKPNYANIRLDINIRKMRVDNFNSQFGTLLQSSMYLTMKHDPVMPTIEDNTMS